MPRVLMSTQEQALVLSILAAGQDSQSGVKGASVVVIPPAMADSAPGSLPARIWLDCCTVTQ